MSRNKFCTFPIVGWSLPSKDFVNISVWGNTLPSAYLLKKHVGNAVQSSRRFTSIPNSWLKPSRWNIWKLLSSEWGGLYRQENISFSSRVKTDWEYSLCKSAIWHFSVSVDVLSALIHLGDLSLAMKYHINFCISRPYKTRLLKHSVIRLDWFFGGEFWKAPLPHLVAVRCMPTMCAQVLECCNKRYN